MLDLVPPPPKTLFVLATNRCGERVRLPGDNHRHPVSAALPGLQVKRRRGTITPDRSIEILRVRQGKGRPSQRAEHAPGG
jgi:hypothetical protein